MRGRWRAKPDAAPSLSLKLDTAFEGDFGQRVDGSHACALVGSYLRRRADRPHVLPGQRMLICRVAPVRARPMRSMRLVKSSMKSRIERIA